ncbi:c-type cytochrome domain-containing protein [Singulisphaera acidiphila]|uniref:WD40 repeat-containing protein n=1 Tax=Singulisphaera acidiphila (strain ATCC BAA-1392 / DSM 18658 / VKM B-2454 / MOB10) TaxID=886293 RepID=L0DDX0_SINAD|nr:c-type cytochrome domain-containing protein [Singulisphaera acidiphila]AGA27023.1 WD40 repeat-containing protein [Singulisphaera acidiphila DSM 18658]
MTASRRLGSAWKWVAPIVLVQGAGGEEPPRPPTAPGPVSFLDDVAPLLVQKCIACHNAKKAESKYDLTTFTRLAKGGQQGVDITLEPGQPEESRLVELIRHDGEPRMPHKQGPLASEAVALIERWVKEGARYDGDNPDEDWVALLRRRARIIVPERYQTTVPIASVAFSPDGTAVATSGNHEVNLWKIPDGTPGHRLRGVAERVHEIAYSPNGHWLATASGDPGRAGSVKLWSALPSGQAEPGRQLFEGDDSVFAVAFSPDSAQVAAAGSDRTIRVWDVESGKLLTTIDDHADWILGLAFSPDGRLLATASRDKTSKVFDWAKKATLATFAGHADTVYSVAFTPDGRRIATGGGDGLIRIWNPTEDAKQEASLSGFKGPVFRVRYSPDGQNLVASSADRTVRVFQGNQPRLTLEGHTDWIHALAISPDGLTIASGSWDGDVRLWRLADGKPAGTFLAAPGLSKLTSTAP